MFLILTKSRNVSLPDLVEIISDIEIGFFLFACHEYNTVKIAMSEAIELSISTANLNSSKIVLLASNAKLWGGWSAA